MQRGRTLSFKHAILGLLADGPLHGYELKGAYENELVPTAKLNFGQVYTTLERLSRDGLVEFQQVNQVERPDKKVYSLTELGLAELKEWLTSPTTPISEERNGTFLKLSLAERINDFDALACLQLERDACFRRLQELTRAKLEAESSGASHQTVMLFELATLRLEAFLKWLDRYEEVLREKANE